MRRYSLRSSRPAPGNALQPWGTESTAQPARASPSVSEDGKLFFFTTRADGFGAADIHVSRRISTGADGDVWGEPVNLGPDVNTAAAEQAPYYTREGPNAVLYFNRATVTAGSDIYQETLSHDGLPLGPALPL